MCFHRKRSKIGTVLGLGNWRWKRINKRLSCRRGVSPPSSPAAQLYSKKLALCKQIAALATSSSSSTFSDVHIFLHDAVQLRAVCVLAVWHAVRSSVYGKSVVCDKADRSAVHDAAEFYWPENEIVVHEQHTELCSDPIFDLFRS